MQFSMAACSPYSRHFTFYLQINMTKGRRLFYAAEWKLCVIYLYISLYKMSGKYATFSSESDYSRECMVLDK